MIIIHMQFMLRFMKKTLLIGTRKGLIVARKMNGSWHLGDVHQEGVPVSIAYADPRTNTWWACFDHEHWGVKMQRSADEGQTWEEVAAPAYPEGSEIKEGVPAATRYLWAMQQGGSAHPHRLWVGTEPGGLFQSTDQGNTFQLVESLWNHPSRTSGQWFGGGRDHAGIHSVVIDPRNEDRILIGVSCAGVFESTDAGQHWQVRNQGLRADFLPDPHAEFGHDPHILIASPTNPDILWQQNHCGIFKSEDGARTWQDISDPDGEANFGFALSVASDNADQAWVAPANSDVTRVALQRKLCICRKDDGGKSWTTFRKGLPQEHCFDIVYRHALVSDGDDVLFGTTTGNLFHSADRGESWTVISNYLPMVYSLQLI